MAALKFFIDTTNKRLVSAFDSRSAFTLPNFFVGDSGLDFELHLLEESSGQDIDRPYQYVSPSGKSFKVGLGLIDQAPTSGTFTLTDPDNSQTSGGIAYNASAAAVQTEIRSSLSTAYSSATVTGSDGGPWTIDRGAATDVSELTGSGAGLFPDSFVGVTNLRDGTASLNKLQRIDVLQQPAAYHEPSTALPSATVTVSTLQTGSGTANEIQRVSLNADTYGGTFTLTATTVGSGNGDTKTSAAIAYNATEETVKTTLDAAFGTNSQVTVTKVDNTTWDIEFTGTDVDLYNHDPMTGDATGLSVPVGVSGTLNLNTATALLALGTQADLDVTFEVEQTSGGKINTLVQTSTTLVNDLNNPASSGAGEIPNPDNTYLRLDGSNMVSAPASAGATGAVGQIAIDTNYFYICIATDTWRRTPMASWS